MSENLGSYPVSDAARENITSQITEAGNTLIERVRALGGVFAYYDLMHGVLPREATEATRELVSIAYPGDPVDQLISDEAYSTEVGLTVGLGLAFHTDKLNSADSPLRRSFVADIGHLISQIKQGQLNEKLVWSLARISNPAVAKIMIALPTELTKPFGQVNRGPVADRSNALYQNGLGYASALFVEDLSRYEIIKAQPDNQPAYAQLEEQAEALTSPQVLEFNPKAWQ